MIQLRTQTQLLMKLRRNLGNLFETLLIKFLMTKILRKWKEKGCR